MIETIRQSMLNQWARCPEQFRRRYLENDVIPPGVAARIGTGLHKGAEVNHKAKIVTGMDEPLDVVQDAARDGYVKAVREGGVFFAPEEAPKAKQVLAEGVDTAVALARCYHAEVAPTIQPKLVERRITMESGLSVPFSGTIDVLTDDHRWIDLKTSSSRWSQSRADYEIQATLYNELVRAETGAAPRELSYEIFVKNKTIAHQTIKTTRTDGDFAALVARAGMMLNMISAGIFPPAEPGHWMCSPRWCGYWWTCPHIPESRKLLPKRSV